MNLLLYQILGILCIIVYALSDWLFDDDIIKYLSFIIGIVLLVIIPWIIR